MSDYQALWHAAETELKELRARVVELEAKLNRISLILAKERKP